MKKRIGLLTYATLASTMFVAGAVSAAALDISTANQTAGAVLDVGGNTPLTFSGAGSIVVSGATHAISATTNASVTATITNTTADTEVLASGTGSAFVIPAAFNTAAQTVALVIGSSAKVTGGADAYYIDPGVTNNGAISLDNSGTLTSTTGHGIKITNTVARTNAFSFTNQAAGNIVASTAAKAGLDSEIASGAATVAMTNSGTITADRGVHINNGTGTGNVTFVNSGTINANALEAFKYAAGGTTASTITNSGTMKTVTGTSAISLNTLINGAGKVSNTGTITSTADGSVGVNVVAGGIPLIENLAGGTIQSLGSTLASYGVNAGVAVTVLTNAGTIKSTGGSAIRAAAGVGIGTLNNSGTITKGSTAGAAAIDLSAQTTATTISNTAGTVTGDIKLTNQADTFSLSGGAIVGNVDGTLGAAIKTLNISGGSLTGNVSLLAAGNVMNVSGSFTTGGTMSNTRNLNITNAGTTFTVGHALTGVDTAISVAAGTKLRINEAGSLVTTVGAGPTIATNATGVLSFQLGKGIDTANTGTAPGTINTNGFISVPTTGVPLTAANILEISQSGSGYTANGAKFYVMRGTGFTGGNLVTVASTSTANTALLSFAPTHDATGVLFTATRTAPAAVNFTKVNSLTEKAARPVLVEMDRIGLLNVAANNTALNPTFGAIQAITSASSMADEIARLAPQVNGSATRSATVASQGVIGNTTSQRLADLRDDLAGEKLSYAASSERHSNKKHGLWGQFVGNKAIQRTRDGVVGFDGRTFGLALGGDMLVNPNFVAGISAGYAKTGVDSRHVVRDRTDINTYSGIVYGSYGIDAHWYVDGSANYSRHRYTGRRNITAPGANSIAYSKYYGNQYGARVMTGYHHNYQDWQVTPMAGLRFSNLNLDTYTETGTATTPVLRVDSKSSPETMLSGGARFRFHHDVRGGRVLPEFHAMLNYDFSAKAHRAGSQFVVAGAPVGNVFLSEGAKEPKFSWNAGAGLTLSSFRHWHATVQYDYTGKSQFSAHAGMLNLRYTW